MYDWVQVLVYNFADLRMLHSIETLSNPSGLLALSAEASNTVLACPGLHQGEVGPRQICISYMALWVWTEARRCLLSFGWGLLTTPSR